MYSKFKLESIPLKDIDLDYRNPRVVTREKLKTQEQVLAYLFEHEELAEFIKTVAAEGKNRGAERPYVVEEGDGYVVIEGNTRIAAYKVLTGLLVPPKDYAASVPQVSAALKKTLATVDCSVAPSRDALLPIMARAHFGRGDKSKWGYLGSRKAVYDEHLAGRSVSQLAKAFAQTKSEIADLIIEYELYMKALSLGWTTSELNVLLNPSVEFNPPVRFLQTSGHKAQVGIQYDKANLQVLFNDAEAEKKYKHLIRKLVINPERGLGATARYDDVFADYNKLATGSGKSKTKSGSGAKGTGAKGGQGSGTGATGGKLPSDALFSYPVTVNNNLLKQLMLEAKDIRCKKLPAASTFLLRNIVEALLKEIIHQQGANSAGHSLDLEKSLNICLTNSAKLSQDDTRILK